MSRRDDYQKNGYCVIDDFLPLDVADKLAALYNENDDWINHSQVREDHFKHVFFTNSPYFPDANEAYRAKFQRSSKLEVDPFVQKIISRYTEPVLENFYGEAVTEHNLRCYQIHNGGYYRTHIDDYLGDIGCIYYVNKRWVWDWGGILHVGRDVNKDEIIPIFPKFNRAVLVNHGEFRFPHFVSPVAEYARAPRQTMITFSSPEKI